MQVLYNEYLARQDKETAETVVNELNQRNRKKAMLISFVASLLTSLICSAMILAVASVPILSFYGIIAISVFWFFLYFVFYRSYEPGYSHEPEYSFAAKYYIATNGKVIVDTYIDEDEPIVYIAVRESDDSISRIEVGRVQEKEFLTAVEPVLDVNNGVLRVPADIESESVCGLDDFS